MFTLKGKLIVKNDTQQISDKFKKREFVLLDDSTQYPQPISFQVVQDKCELLDKHNIGDEITVNFNVRGKEWTSPKDGETRYFNSLEAWKIGGANEAPVKIPSAVPASSGVEDNSDDLPF